MNRQISSLLVGALSLTTGLTGCNRSAEESSLDLVSSKPAARVSIPMDPNSLSAWTPSSNTVITYYLNIGSTFKPQFQEAFREWSVGLSTWSDHFRFVEVSDPEAANIRINSSTVATQAGCTYSNGTKFCDLNWKARTAVSFWIGRIMGVPVSANSGDVMYEGQDNSLFTASDFQNMSYAYGYTMGRDLEPIFDVKYYNYTGWETVIGWESLRSRSKPAPIYVSLATRVLVGSVIKNIPYPSGYATFPLNTYQNSYNYGTSNRFAYWPFQSTSYPDGLSGTDAAPGRLGDNSCVDASFKLINAPSAAPTATTGYRIFGYNPAAVGMYWYQSTFTSGIINHGVGPTAPLYFYKDAATGSFRVASSVPAGNSCYRLGGWGFAVQ